MNSPDTDLYRFLIVVLGTYKQMRNQKIDIMADVDEENFDRAFDIFQPGKKSQTLASLALLLIENYSHRWSC